MKQIPIDKYNIAWFKLAEYVSRGEKERALGVYRLLSHSFDDAAFALQLEGDILWSFNDRGAIDKYYEAAQLYKKDARVLQAAAVYEHLVTLHPDSIVCLLHLVDLYVILDAKSKVASNLAVLAELVLGLVAQKKASQELVLENLKEFVERLMVHQDAQQLNNFLSRLNATNGFYYQQVVEYIREKSNV